MWADSTFRDLVQYNDGFRTGLIGTPEQVAHRIVEYKKRGVDLFLLGFLHFIEEIEQFGRDGAADRPGARGRGDPDRRAAGGLSPSAPASRGRRAPRASARPGLRGVPAARGEGP